MKKRENMKRNLILALVSGLGITLLLTFNNDFFTLKNILLETPLWLIPLCFSFYFVIYLVDALRLKIVTSPFGYNVTLIDRAANGILGCFYSNITPFAAGGQPYQIYQLTDRGVKADVSTAIIMTRFVEYLLTSISVSIWALVYMSLKEGAFFTGTAIDSMLYGGLCVSVIVTMFFLLAIFKTAFILPLPVKLLEKAGKQQWAAKLKDFALEMNSAVCRLWRKSKYILAVDTVAGMINLLLQGLSLWVSLLVISSHVPGPLFVTMLFILMNLVVYFLPTPGASGGIEGLYSLVFTYFTGDPAGTTAAVIIWRFSTYYLHIIFQIIFNIFYNRRSIHENSHADVILFSS